MPGANPHRHSGWQRRVAAVLLVVQVTVGSAVTLAHAGEASGGPVRLEAHHSAQCVVLHDAARCAQCQFNAIRVVAPATRHSTWSNSAGRCFPSPLVTGVAPNRTHTGVAHPRAPPLSLS